MAARNELYRKTMELLDAHLGGEKDEDLKEVVRRHFKRRNSRVGYLETIYRKDN